jgi:hypothetical protein
MHHNAALHTVASLDKYRLASLPTMPIINFIIMLAHTEYTALVANDTAMIAHDLPVPAPMSATCTTMSAVPSDHPYTASYLSRLATCILHTPRPKLKRIFTSDSLCPISSLHLDASSPRPDPLIAATCRRLMSMLNSENSFPNTIPLMLCLLLRYRMLPNADLAWCDESYILIAAFLLAHKFLADYGDARMLEFARAMDMSKHDLIHIEWEFLKAIEYSIWVKDDEFERNKQTFNELWADVYSKAGIDPLF